MTRAMPKPRPAEQAAEQPADADVVAGAKFGPQMVATVQAESEAERKRRQARERQRRRRLRQQRERDTDSIRVAGAVTWDLRDALCASGLLSYHGEDRPEAVFNALVAASSRWAESAGAEDLAVRVDSEVVARAVQAGLLTVEDCEDHGSMEQVFNDLLAALIDAAARDMA
ncbi:MAG: hypothetical protein Kow0032_28730 [Methyloligellaceae bacterium]